RPRRRRGPRPPARGGTVRLRGARGTGEPERTLTVDGLLDHLALRGHEEWTAGPDRRDEEIGATA
ncbi:hypothetical protein ABT404_53420, partial [Streptomyces hyaluromycini]